LNQTDNAPRDHRNKFLAAQRKKSREAFYNKLLCLVIDQSKGIDTKDMLYCVRLLEHKLSELIELQAKKI
jgi:hypothetical protein